MASNYRKATLVLHRAPRLPKRSPAFQKTKYPALYSLLKEDFQCHHRILASLAKLTGDRLECLEEIAILNKRSGCKMTLVASNTGPTEDGDDFFSDVIRKTYFSPLLVMKAISDYYLGRFSMGTRHVAPNGGMDRIPATMARSVSVGSLKQEE